MLFVMGLFGSKKKKEVEEETEEQKVPHFIWISQDNQEEVDSGSVERHRKVSADTGTGKEEESKKQKIEELLKKARESYDRGNFTRSMTYLNLVLALEENYPFALALKSLLYARKGEYDKALKQFEKAEKRVCQKKTEWNASFYYDWSLLLLRVNDYEKAFEMNEKALENNPQYPEALNNREAFKKRRLKMKNIE